MTTGRALRSVPGPLPGEIAQKVAGFTGRAGALREVVRWATAEDTDGGILLVTGAPGVGKSSFAGRLVQISRGEASEPGAESGGRPFRVRAAYFCAYRDRSGEVVRRLSEQLADHVPGFRPVLSDASGGHLDIRVDINVLDNLGSITGVDLGGTPPVDHLVDRFLRRPMAQVVEQGAAREPTVVLVDGVDMLPGAEAQQLAQALRAADIPGLKLVLTSRPDPRIVSVLHRQDGLDLGEARPADLADVAEYARRELAGTRLPHGVVRRLARRVAEAAEGNFLYARYVTRDLRDRAHDLPLDVSIPLPADLTEVYQEFLGRRLNEAERPTEEWEGLWRPVLRYLAAALGEGLSHDRLVRLSGLPPERVTDVLRKCAPFLREAPPEGPHRLYHESFRDYLRAPGEGIATKLYSVSTDGVHRAIAQSLLDRWEGRWHECDEAYALDHVAEHMALADAEERVDGDPDGWPWPLSVLADAGYLGARLAAGMVRPLHRDLARCLGCYGGAPPRLLAELHRAVLLLGRRRLRAGESSAYTLHRARMDLPIEEPDAREAAVHLCQALHFECAVNGARGLANVFAGQLERDGHERLLLLWAAAPGAGRRLHRLTRVKGMPMAARVSSEARYVIEVGEDGSAAVWDLTAAEQPVVRESGKNFTHAATAAREGETFALGSGEGIVEVWTGPPPFRERRRFIGLADRVSALALSDDGRHVAAAAWDGRVAVCATRTGRAVARWRERSPLVALHLLEPTGPTAVGLLYGVGADGAVRVWNLPASGRPIRLAAPLPPAVSAAANGSSTHWPTHRPTPLFAVAQEAGLALYGTGSGDVVVHDLATGEVRATVPTGYRGALTAIDVTPDGRRAVVGCADQVARVLDPAERSTTATLPGHPAAITGVAISADGSRVVTMTTASDEDLRVWDPRPPAPLTTTSGAPEAPDGTTAVQVHSGTVTGLVFSWDGRTLASCSADGTARVWTAASGDGRLVLHHETRDARAVDIDRHGRRAVTVDTEGRVRLWRTADGGLVRELSPRVVVSGAPPVRFLDQGRTLAVGASDWTVHLYRADDGKPLRRLEGLPGPLLQLGEARGGRWILASDGSAPRVAVWSRRTGRLLRILDAPPDEEQLSSWSLHQLCVPGDGDHVAGCSPDQLYLWHVRSGRCVVRHAAGLPAVADPRVPLLFHHREWAELGMVVAGDTSGHHSVPGSAAFADMASDFAINHPPGTRSAHLAAIAGERVSVLDLDTGGRVDVVISDYATALAAHPHIRGVFAVGTHEGMVLVCAARGPAPR
ncbi:hypothetical protein ACFV2X_24535 [Streptomyces sp. NPDC059679]|uniref:hypothetical protein n=1 Tax=Streptomyces sp. NPDC059679 TaxID=3346903 RepID=UPI003695C580